MPAAGVLQKCWRGKKGRDEGALRRRMAAAATEIQVSIHVSGLKTPAYIDLHITHFDVISRLPSEYMRHELRR